MNESPPLARPTSDLKTTTPEPRPLPRFRFLLVCVLLFWVVTFVLDAADKAYFIGFMAKLACTGLLSLLFLGWWWFNRGLRLWAKCAGFALLLGEAWVVGMLTHRSITPFTVWLAGFPVVTSLMVVWLTIARRARFFSAPIGFALVVTLGWGFLLFVRFDGADSTLKTKAHWRWTPTPEEQLLAESKVSPLRPPTAFAAGTNALATTDANDWTDFRGPNRDGAVLNSTIATNWTDTPPALLWKRAVGPAWSSLLVVHHRVYTQEQRGEKELVACYDALSGDPMWIHEDTARFDEAVSGAGPRATPTFANGRLYTLGGTGLLNCLDAETGRLIWGQDIKAVSQAKVAMWGFASSPLVAGDLVVVYAGGEAGKGLLGYKSQSGELAWAVEAGGSSYSSPQLTSLAGVSQCLMLHDAGLTAVDVTTGKELWKTGIAMKGAPRCGQPRLIDGNQLLVATLGGLGCSLIEVSKAGSSWAVTNKWESKELKPEFPDFVLHNGHAYGFDIGIFCCLRVADGKRAWKEGRYGRGQVMLLRDQNLLLVLSETGELVLLVADPAAHRELGRCQALNGKSWNHPVVLGDRVYLRNAEELACYSLSAKPAKILSTSAR